MIKIFREFDLFIKLILLLIFSVFLVYYLPASIARIAFLLLLIPIGLSKKDFFWFAFVLILLEQPGGLFSGGMVGDPHRLPIYNLFSGISFSFEELYILLILIKPAINKELYFFKSFPFRRQYNSLGLLLLFLIITSIALGLSFDSFRNIYKTIINISLYISAIFVFKKEEDIIGFFKVLFPFVFIAILLQLYDIKYNQQIIALFKPGVELAQGVLTGKLLRPIELSVILLLSFFGSLLFLNIKNPPFSKKYLILINISAIISIIMTATRSWFLGFIVMYLYYILFNFNQIKQTFIYAITGIIFVIFIILIIPSLKTQITNAFSRIETVEQLASGDETAGGTLSRLTVRGPRVMEGFMSSTIILGAGFSNLFYKYADGHVGYQNILLNSGIIGFLLLMLFALKIIITPIKLSVKIKNSSLKWILRNIPLLMPAVLIINSGSQFWGFNISQISRIMMLSFYFALISVYVNKQKTLLREEEKEAIY